MWTSLLDNRFEKYITTLVELLIIWVLTTEQYKPLKFSKYLKTRQKLRAGMWEKLMEAYRFHIHAESLKFHKNPTPLAGPPVTHVPYVATRPRPVASNGDPDDDPDESSSSKLSRSSSFPCPSWMTKPSKSQGSHHPDLGDSDKP